MPSLWSSRYSIWGKLYQQCMLNAALCYTVIGCIYWVSYRTAGPGILQESGQDLVRVFLMVMMSIMLFTLILFIGFTLVLGVSTSHHRYALIGCSLIPLLWGMFGLYSMRGWVYTNHVVWLERMLDIYQNTLFN